MTYSTSALCRGSSTGAHHGFQIHEFVQTIGSEFAAMARAFDAAERASGEEASI